MESEYKTTELLGKSPIDLSMQLCLMAARTFDHYIPQEDKTVLIMFTMICRKAIPDHYMTIIIKNKFNKARCLGFSETSFCTVINALCMKIKEQLGLGCNGIRTMSELLSAAQTRKINATNFILGDPEGGWEISMGIKPIVDCEISSLVNFLVYGGDEPIIFTCESNNGCIRKSCVLSLTHRYTCKYS